MGALFIFKMENKTSKNILTYIIIIAPIVIYILITIITYSPPLYESEIQNEIKIQNQISDISNRTIYQDTINNKNIPKKMIIFKTIVWTLGVLIILIIIFLLLVIGMGYLIKGIYLRIVLFKKFGIFKFNSVNKITL